MNLPFFISRRYLFARKSHNVINLVSAISMAGMAVGTAALILILSIYNGFNSLVENSFSEVDPDILVTPARGKVFLPDHEAFRWACAQESVAALSEVLEDNVFISYGDQQALAKAKGVDEVYEAESLIRNHLKEGEFRLHHGSVPMASVSIGLSYRLGISPRFVEGIRIYYPSRTGRLSLANPAASVESVKIWPSCVFSVNSDVDNNLMVVPIEVMRTLLQYESEVSAVEIRLAEGASKEELSRLIKGLGERLGDGYKVSDRYRQKESIYKMMRYEKAAIFLILLFIIVIIAFNIFGSMSMLIIEKDSDIDTLRCMGAEKGPVRRIFVLEGWFVSLTGLAGGLLLGIAFASLQQHFGFLKMPGSFLVEAYPVIIRQIDIILTALGVALVGYLIALIPARKIDF